MRTFVLLTLMTGLTVGTCISASVAPATRSAPVVQPATSQPAVIPTVLHFNEKSIKAILAGTKTVSVRKGIRTFSQDGIKAIGTQGTTVMLKILDAAQKKVGELTAEDATGNGSASLDDLKAELARNYPGINADDVVTVIKFRLN